MRNTRNLALSVLAPLALGLAFVAVPAFARTNPGATASHTKVQMQQPQQPQTFTGTIVKSSSGPYVLEMGGTTYQLNDQTDAAKYVGKQVKVTGTLDPTTDTIEVSSIKPTA